MLFISANHESSSSLVPVQLVGQQSLRSVCRLPLSVSERGFGVMNVKAASGETHIPYISH